MNRTELSEKICLRGVNIKVLRNIRARFGKDDLIRQVAEDHVKFWTYYTSDRSLSLAQVLESSYRNRQHPELHVTFDEGAGDANVFVSYAWDYKVHDFVDALESFLDKSKFPKDITYFWIDFITSPQHQLEEKPEDYFETTFKNAISEIGFTLLLLIPWDKATSLTRAWCIWEIFCTVETRTQLSVIWNSACEREIKETMETRPDEIQHLLANLDVRNCEAWVPSDKEKILRAMRGKEDEVSEQVKYSIQQALVRSACVMSNEGISCWALQTLKEKSKPGYNCLEFYDTLYSCPFACLHPLEEKVSMKDTYGLIEALREGRQIFVDSDKLELTYEDACPNKDKADIFVSYCLYCDFVDHCDSINNFEKWFSKTVYGSTRILSYSDIFSENASVKSKLVSETRFDDAVLIATSYAQRLLSIGKVLVVLLPWHNPLVFSRIWCVFEIYLAIKYECPLYFSTSDDQQNHFLITLFSDFDRIRDAIDTCGRICVSPLYNGYPSVDIFSSDFNDKYALALIDYMLNCEKMKRTGNLRSDLNPILIRLSKDIAMSYKKWMIETAERFIFKQNRIKWNELKSNKINQQHLIESKRQRIEQSIDLNKLFEFDENKEQFMGNFDRLCQLSL